MGFWIPRRAGSAGQGKAMKALAMQLTARGRAPTRVIISRIVRFCEDFKNKNDFKVVPGNWAYSRRAWDNLSLAQEARKLGAKVIRGPRETYRGTGGQPGKTGMLWEAGVDILGASRADFQAEALV